CINQHISSTPPSAATTTSTIEARQLIYSTIQQTDRPTHDLDSSNQNRILRLPKDANTLSTAEIIKRKFGAFSTERVGPLFHTKQLGWTTVLLWSCWLTIGMGYPLFNAFLPQYLANCKGSDGEAVSTNITHRNYATTSIVGVPGSIIACWTVDIKYIGIFLFLFTLSVDSKYQVAFWSIEAFFQNIMYGILYAYTLEVFPAPNRETGTGNSSFLDRIAGLCAPIIAANIPNANANAPVFVSGGLILAAFIGNDFPAYREEREADVVSEARRERGRRDEHGL
ncbi:hypothetical protein BDZ45DRAFT_49369, partial [Acephala macrosclerotiorum]